jgi:hypothetical protein
MKSVSGTRGLIAVLPGCGKRTGILRARRCSRRRVEVRRRAGASASLRQGRLRRKPYQERNR